MRTRNTDGTQRYAVLGQLPQYTSIPLKLGLNVGYISPVNVGSLGLPYLYFGFLPVANSAVPSVQGLTINGLNGTFNNQLGIPNSYISLFPNFLEIDPRTSYSSVTLPLCNLIFTSHKRNPSGRVMPGEYFMSAEINFGGDGCYTSTNRMDNIGVLSTTIGFRWESHIGDWIKFIDLTNDTINNYFIDFKKNIE